MVGALTFVLFLACAESGSDPVTTVEPPAITTATLPPGALATPYSQLLAATGGDGTFSWTLSSGELPAGLSLNAESGAIVGTPTAAGSSTFTVLVTSAGQTASRAFTIVVTGGPPAIATTSLPSAVLGTPYNQTLSASGGDGRYSWGIVAGGLPAGLSLIAATGTITGTPTIEGSASFTLRVTSAGQVATRTLSIAINASGPSITTSSLPGGVVGAEYSQRLAATGGDFNYTWSIAGGALPAGVALNPATGVISGTPTAPGSSTFVAQVASAGQTATRSLSIAVVASASGLAITTSALPSGTVGAAYDQTLAVSGGTGTYSWAITGGGLPFGLSLNAATGAITGAPIAAGSYPFIVRVTSGGQSVTRELSIVVNGMGPEITTASLPNAAVGTAYNQGLAVAGGDGTYVWTVVSGTLPAGLSLSPTTGAITGTPTAPGTSSFTVRVTSAGQTSSRELSIVVSSSAPVIGTTTLPAAVVGAPYTQTLTVTGGAGGYVWSIASGALPAGLSLSASTGTISGTPTAAGSSSFTVRVTSGTQSATRALSLAANATAPTITTTALPNALVGTAYNQTLRATGGDASYVWVRTGGTLPAGLALNPSTGAITGTPTTVGTSSFTVEVTSAGQTAGGALSLTVSANGPVITTGALAGGTAGSPYSQTVSATGGILPYVWSIVSGALPAGLSLNASTGAISGTPTASGTSSFTVRVTGGGVSSTQALSITINATAPDITTTSLPAGTAGQAYSQTLAATGGDGAYAWSIVSGSLPVGLSLNPGTGAITGTPTAGGSASFTVQVTSAGQSSTQALSITVNASAPVITTTSLAAGVAGSPYSAALAATGGTGTYSWSLASGTLPAGLSLNAGTGAITGTPTASGTSSFTVRATSGGQSSTQALSITVNASAPTITTASLPAAAAGQAYNQTLAASGGVGGYAWSIVSGALPAGLSLNASTGAITGTPSSAGTASFTVQVSSGGQTSTRALSITVSASGPVITIASLPGGVAGSPYSQALTASGGSGTYSWAIASGALPAGLSLNASTGAITGTPSAIGTASFTVRVTSGGQSSTQALSITINATAPDITTTSLPAGTAGQAYNQTLAATGGDGMYGWAIVGGSLPSGLSLNASTGAITGTPAVGGSASFTVQVTSAGQSSTRALSITVNASAPVITTSSLAAGVAGSPYGQTLTATGGTGTYSWSLASGALPAGLSLNASTGAITGTPAATGTSAFTVRATSGGQSGTQALSITINASAPVVTTSSLPGATAGQAYNQTLAASGGGGAYTWAIVSGALPAGLSLNPSTGAITGTPTTGGTSGFTVQVTSGGQSSTQALSIAVAAAPVAVTTTSLAGGTRGTSYNQTLLASGGTGSFTWSLAGGALPAGLALNASTGAITGTPTAAGTSSFTVQASSGGSSATQALSIAVVNPPVGITTATLPNGTRTVGYSQTLVATGGTGSGYTWSVVSGALPAGLSLNASTGAITGTPTTAATSTFTVQASSGGSSATRALSLTVVNPPVAISTTSLVSGTQGSAYSATLVATGGTGSYTWALASGTLPAGLSLNASTGAITGTPTSSGTSSFTVRATSGGVSATRALTLTVAGGGGGSASPVLDINFESYGSTSALMAACGTTGPSVAPAQAFRCSEDAQSGGGAGGVASINLDPSVAPPGLGLTKSMRYDYMHPGTGCNSITIGRAIRITPVQEAWAEFYVRWSPNFTTTNNSCAPNDHKLIFGDTEADGSGRWAFYVGADSGPFHSIQVERPLSPSGFLGAYYMNNDPTDHMPNPDMWDGNWHVIRLYYRNSTTPSSNDGAMKVWIDGELTHTESGFNTVKDSGGAERLEGFSFAHNKDDGPPGVLMSLWWGRIRVYTSNPGW